MLRDSRIKILVILFYFFVSVSFSQKNKIVFDENEIKINDSIIYSNGVLKNQCVKQFDKTFKTKNKSKRSIKGYSTTYFYKDIGLELYYSWKNKCNLDRITVNLLINCPDCNLLYKDAKEFKNYTDVLYLLNIKISKDMTVESLKKENILSNNFTQKTFKEKNYIEYSNERLKYIIYFNGNTDTSKILNISVELYRL